MLAKAVATEGGASFLSVDASSVENKWLGESEKNAKAVFTLARRLAPCVIFIDEVDSLLSSREGSSDDSAHGTLTSVKTTMMSEWDGLNSGTNGSVWKTEASGYSWWDAPIFSTTGYESTGWVRGKRSAGSRLCCWSAGAAEAEAAQPAANSAGVR